MKIKPVGIELRSLNNLIRRYFENNINKKQVDIITGTNGWIIGYLAENTGCDIYQKDVEEEFGITRSTASKVLILMEQKGLVVRNSVSHDARLKKLTLTEKAWKVSKLMKEDADLMEKTLTKGFTEEELQKLHDYLEKMKNNMKNC